MKWDVDHDVWIEAEESLFDEEVEPFRDYWPLAGVMINGEVYELPAYRPIVADDHEGVPFLPTPLVPRFKAEDDAQEFRERRKEVEDRTGTRAGPKLEVVAKSIVDKDYLTVETYRAVGNERSTHILPTPNATFSGALHKGGNLTLTGAILGVDETSDNRLPFKTEVYEDDLELEVGDNG
jgi:hypothetical protein